MSGELVDTRLLLPDSSSCAPRRRAKPVPYTLFIHEGKKKSGTTVNLILQRQAHDPQRYIDASKSEYKYKNTHPRECGRCQAADTTTAETHVHGHLSAHTATAERETYQVGF